MNLNEQQRQILIVGFLIIAAMVAYPPWMESRAASAMSSFGGVNVIGAVDSPRGYAPMWEPPLNHGGTVRIDLVRLCIPMAVVVVGTLGLVAMKADKAK
jgi:hypothetical protein